jgi:outer membrane protein OmpA-like peptidoglycan-associated protein
LFLSGRTANEAAPAGATTEAAVGADGAEASGAAVDLASAPAEGSVAIPAGAGVTSELRDGKPVVKVYFDTAKTDVAAAFGGTAAGLKAYLAANPGAKLAISGYSDPSGNAAANAELSKKRAQAVQAALVSAGIPAEAAELVKPAESADASVPKEAARRVEVTVQ